MTTEPRRRKRTRDTRRARRNSSTGYLGVYPVGAGKFGSILQVANVKHYLGMHDTPEQAHEAYIAARRRLHPSGWHEPEE